MNTKCSKSYIVYMIVFSSLLVIFRIISFNEYDACFEEYIDFSYGYVDFWHPKSINFSTINWLLPYLGYILFWGNYLEKMFVSNASMLVFRSKKRGNLLLSYYFEIFIYVLVGFLIQFIVVYIIMAIQSGNYIISISAILKMIIVILFCFNSVLFVNCMSLYISAKYCVLFLLIVQIASVKFVLMMLDGYKEYIKYVHVSTTIFILDYFNVHINELFSIIYNLILCISIIAINGLLFKNKDIL